MKRFNNSIMILINFIALTFLFCISSLEAAALPPRYTVNESVQLNNVQFGVVAASDSSKINLMENPFSDRGGCIVELFSFVSSQAKSMTKDKTKKKGDETDDSTLRHLFV